MCYEYQHAFNINVVSHPKIKPVHYLCESCHTHPETTHTYNEVATAGKEQTHGTNDGGQHKEARNEEPTGRETQKTKNNMATASELKTFPLLTEVC